MHERVEAGEEIFTDIDVLHLGPEGHEVITQLVRPEVDMLLSR